MDDLEAPQGPFLYFGYGSNLDVERMHLYCPSARLVSVARLEGHRLAFSIESKQNWRGGVADIVPEPDAVTWGALWVVDASESDALDRHEGVFRDPPAYRRTTVDVETMAGDRVRCRSYQVAHPDPRGFAPSPAYKETLLRGARALGLPEDYVRNLERIEDNGGAATAG